MIERDSRSNKENCTIFIALKDGSIYYADDLGHCDELVVMPSKIASFIFRECKDELLVLTDDLVLSHFKHSPDGKLMLGNSVRLNGGVNTNGISTESIWVKSEALAWSLSGKCDMFSFREHPAHLGYRNCRNANFGWK
jgi:hypothetical protein